MGVQDIYVIGNKKMQRKMAMEFGVPGEHFCDTREQDVVEWMNSVTAGQGADVFFDCVGKSQVLEQAIQCVCAGGRIMLVGNPASDVCLEKNLYWKILRRQLTLKGTWNSSYRQNAEDDWHVVLDTIQNGGIHPEQLITHRFALAELWRGLECMRDKKEEYVKMTAVL